MNEKKVLSDTNKRKSERRKKNKHIYSLYTKILEERILTEQYR